MTGVLFKHYWLQGPLQQSAGQKTTSEIPSHLLLLLSLCGSYTHSVDFCLGVDQEDTQTLKQQKKNKTNIDLISMLSQGLQLIKGPFEVECILLEYIIIFHSHTVIQVSSYMEFYEERR